MEHYRNNNILNYSIYLCNNELIKAKNGFGPVFTRQFTYNNYHKKIYYRKFLLQMPDNLDDGLGVPDWRLVICLVIVYLIMAAALIRGVQSSGKVIRKP